MLYAWSLGIGSVCLRAINRENLQKLLHIPKNRKLDCLIGLGYPAHKSCVLSMKDEEYSYYTNDELDIFVPKKDIQKITYWNGYKEAEHEVEP